MEIIFIAVWRQQTSLSWPVRCHGRQKNMADIHEPTERFRFPSSLCAERAARTRGSDARASSHTHSMQNMISEEE